MRFLLCCRENLFSGGEVFFQSFDVGGESFRSIRGDAAGGARHLAFEAFLDGDVTSGCQLVNLHAEVACGGVGLLFEVGEVGLLDPGQDGNHGQAQFRVQERIEFREHGLAVLEFDNEAGDDQYYAREGEDEHLLNVGA